MRLILRANEGSAWRYIGSVRLLVNGALRFDGRAHNWYVEFARQYPDKLPSEILRLAPPHSSAYLKLELE